MKSLLVRDFMSSPVHTVETTEKILTVARIMQENKISCVIVKEDKKPIGIITDRDIISVFASCNWQTINSERANNYYTSPLITINDDEPLYSATVMCRSQSIHHLPVINNRKKLVGVITYSDIVEANYLQFERQTALLGTTYDDENIIGINKHLLDLTLNDPLMEIGNRRAMEIDLKQTQHLGIRYKRPFSIVLIDIDYFKYYNDHYGHQAGDTCLKDIAAIIKENTREVDRVYRYGGEEILILLPETKIDGALCLANRIVEAIYSKKIPHEKSCLDYVSVSAGVTSFEGEESKEQADRKHLIATADDALYDAKKCGKNCVKPSSNDPSQAQLRIV